MVIIVLTTIATKSAIIDPKTWNDGTNNNVNMIFTIDAMTVDVKIYLVFFLS